MKTKDQILAHLKSAGYKRSEIGKIMGFLIGNGTKAPKEAVRYSVGNGSFDDFLAWYQTEDECLNNDRNSCPICTIFEVLFSAMDSAAESGDITTLTYLDELMDILLDIFVEDTSNDNGNE